MTLLHGVPRWYWIPMTISVVAFSIVLLYHGVAA